MSGHALMREMRIKFPNLTIEELLDRVRSEVITQHVSHLRTIKTSDILVLLSEARPWDLAAEDVRRILEEIAKTFPGPIAQDAACLLEGETAAWFLYKFICKIQKDPDPQDRGCCGWFFKHCSGGSSCSRGSGGTGRQSRASRT